jgi:hypothetical protein
LLIDLQLNAVGTSTPPFNPNHHLFKTPAGLTFPHCPPDRNLKAIIRPQILNNVSEEIDHCQIDQEGFIQVGASSPNMD